MDDSKIKERIKKAINIVKDIDPAYQNQAFAEVLRFLLASDETGMTPSISTTQELQKRVPDPIEFLRNKNVVSHSDRVLAIAYFLEKFGGKQGFTANEMKEMFSRCRLSEPANISDIISKQIKRKLLRLKEENEEKSYVLTLEGIQYVESFHR